MKQKKKLVQFNLKKQTRNSIQSYNIDSTHTTKNQISQKYNINNYYKNNEKRDYRNQVMTPDRNIRNTSSPKTKGILKKSPSILKKKSNKIINEFIKNKPTFSFDQKQRTTSSSYHSPKKSERNEKIEKLTNRSNYQVYTSYYSNKSPKNIKTQQISKNYLHNRNQTIDNTLPFISRTQSPRSIIPQTPQNKKPNIKLYTNITNKYKSKAYQSQTIKPITKYSRNIKTSKIPNQNQSLTLINYKKNFNHVKTVSSNNLNYNRTPIIKYKCPKCNKYLVPEKIIKKTIPTMKINLMNINNSSKDRSRNVKLNSKGRKIYDTYQGDGIIERTVIKNTYNPNIYINEKGTSVFKTPTRTSTVVEHVKHENKSNVRYYNNKKTFGHNNMAYYEINTSPKKTVIIRPIHL